jgi:CPA2 family monovalent cation:H+ antiporter-2
MELSSIGGILVILLAALVGGSLAKFLKQAPILGYLISGVVFGRLLGLSDIDFDKLAQLGAIFLLFSIGLELSFSKLGRAVKAAVFGAVLQIALVTFFGYLFLSVFGFGKLVAIILSAGFSLSSTAVVVKILSDRAEDQTIYGNLVIAWLLVQDLAVIPIMVIVGSLSPGFSGGMIIPITVGLLKAGLVIFGTLLVGRLVVPFLIHKVATLN